MKIEYKETQSSVSAPRPTYIPGPDVDGEDGRGGVEDRGERGHDGRHHHRKDQTLQAYQNKTD